LHDERLENRVRGVWYCRTALSVWEKNNGDLLAGAFNLYRNACTF